MYKSIRLFVAGCLALCSAVGFAAPTQPQKGVVRVKLQPEVAARIAAKPSLQSNNAQQLIIGEEAIDASLLKIKGKSMRRVFPCSPERAKEHAKYGLDLWYEVQFDESVSPLEARRILSETPGVTKSTVKRPMVLYDNGKITPVPAPAKAAAGMPFNDPRLSAQWHYYNNGQMNGATPGADINLFKAWKIETGSNRVVVAIIDGGIDVEHEDLAANMWINDAEYNGTPGVDDDGNGYVDDIYGYNFCANNGEIYPHDHGTHVAGTVAAVNNNGKGVCGVAGGDGTPGSGVRLMSVQTYDSRSGVHDGDFAAAIIYAADNGATIAQCSWGWDYPGYYEEDVIDAVRYFTNSARSNNMVGGLCIFAAGNSGETGEFYPQCMDEVIAVAAMTFDLRPANYTNYGEWVDVIAPGGDVTFDQAEGILSTIPNNGYGYKEGTSMATPHVSGIAALVLSKHGAPTLINENVRQQIITSVNDFYAWNPEAEGLMGYGNIDAYKALQWGDGTAPSPVSDLQVAPSQDNATLTWTIPQSSDNQVNSHIIYFSTSTFDENTLVNCQSRVFDTKFYSSGDVVSYEIDNLEPLTTYYFAVKAVDRWSNASPLSQVVSATTNAGPQMTLSRRAMTIRTSDGQSWTTSSFDIGNVGEGYLKWHAYMRTLSSSISLFSNASLPTKPYSGRLALQPYKAAEIAEDIENYMDDDYPQEITNCDELYAFIGDTDQKLTNSMAQLIVVDADAYPAGFNLTHLHFFGSNGLGPTIEIYRNNGTLSTSNLLETIKYPAGVSPYYTDIALTEGLYFAPGESFYVVAHFTEFENRNYPLGMGLSNGNKAASMAYISNDLGATWTLLSEALRESEGYAHVADHATWAIIAISKYPDWSQTLVLDPCEGTLMGNDTETQTVTLSHNGIKIPNGQYRTRLLFETNESNPDPSQTINININVDGNKPEVEYRSVVQFGNLLVGQSKTINIRVTNKGYGPFAGGSTYGGIFSDMISSTSPDFHGPDNLMYGIPARSTVVMPITYSPTEAGSHFGQIIIKDRDGNELKVNVQGAATDPAKIVVDPQIIEVGDINADGTEVELAFTIKNEGKYPLQYVMPKFTDETYEEVASSNTHKFGYNWISNLYGSTQVQYGGRPSLVGATDVSSQMGDYDYFSDPIDIGFDFPFYGRTYDKIYISSLGMLTFASYEEGMMFSPVNETTETYLYGLGVISAYGFEFSLSPSSQVLYARQDGKFIAYFKDVLVSVYDKEKMPASFHIALSPNGDIEIAYDEYTAEKVFQGGCNLWVGIVDPEMDDPLTVTSSEWTGDAFWYDDPSEEKNRWRYINTGSEFHILAPKPNMIKSIQPAAAMLAPNDSVQVHAIVAANDEMYAGATNTLLVVQSNDLTTPTTLVEFKANVVGDLHAVLDLASDKLDFGKVFRTSTAQKPLTVQNHGRNTMTLQSVSLEKGAFSHNFTQALEIPAGQSKDIVITMPTDQEGTVSDVITITTSAGVCTAEIKGQVIGVPDIELSYASAAQEVPYGESVAIPLEIKNTGNETLRYSIKTGQHISYTPIFQDGTAVSYIYESSLDDDSAKREWYDIETNGLGTQHNYTYFLNHDIVAVDLPFSFPYFGKKYDKMYIYDSGFVSFTERDDEGGYWPEPPADFPQGTTYNNVIAPFWGMHSMDISSGAGIYHYVSDDEAVVSYIEYGNSLNYGIDFQLVIRKDGTFTFNYKEAYTGAILFAPFGFAGISDAENNGYKIPERYICLESNVNFYPVVDVDVAPGQSSTADLALNADVLAGTYNSHVEIATNIPTVPSITVPMTLTVTGEPKPIFPEDISVEQVAGYVNADPNDQFINETGAFWYVPLTISNEGAAAFTITSVSIDCPRVDGEKQFSLYWYGTYTNGWTGSAVTGWTPYAGGSIEVATAPVRFAIPLSQSDYSYLAWSTPGTYDIKLTFNLRGIDSMRSKTVNVKVVVTDQPTIEILGDGIHISDAADDQVDIESIVISNEKGAYTLKYSMRVDATGVGEEITPVPFSRYIALSEVGKSDFLYNNPADTTISYRRALYWPALSTSTTSYGFGALTDNEIFKAATAYTGPKDGFNISHIYTTVFPYGLDNKDIIVEIYNGDPQVTDEVLGRGTYHLGQIGNAQQSSMIIIPLDRPVFISEGQQFYVVVSYPMGQAYPAALVLKEHQVVSNRYLGYYEYYGWFDVATIYYDNYGSLGYIMSCLETTEGDAWVKILDGDNAVREFSGEIPAGGKAEVKLRLSAADAPKDLDNRAMIVIKSNDPKQSIINYPVVLDKNGAPVITAPSATLLLSESDTLDVKISIADPEGEDFAILLNDNGQMSAISAISVVGAGDAEIAENRLSAQISGADQGIEMVVSIAAPSISAGSYSFTLSAIDSHGHESSAVVKYMVSHINHAPQPIAVDDIKLSQGQFTAPVAFVDLFDDPDGDELEYSFEISENNSVRVYLSDDSVIFEGLGFGKATVTVTATDSYGASSTNTFKVSVGLGGIDDVEIDNADTPAYSIPGIQVDDSYRGIIVRKGKKYISSKH